MKVVDKELMERRKREAYLVECSDDFHQIKEHIVKAIKNGMTSSNMEKK